MRKKSAFRLATAIAILLFAISFVAVILMTVSCGRRVSQSDSADIAYFESGSDAKMGREIAAGSMGYAESAPPAVANQAPANEFAIRESSLDWMATPVVAAETEAMMVYTANLEVKVDDAPATADKIESITSKNGGYRTAVSQSGKDDKLVIHLQVKVPSAKLWTFLKEVKALGEVENENVTGEDVGDEYFDLKARKDSLDLSLDRLKELLKQSGKLADLLTIEQEVRRVEEQLNQVIGRMKKLENLSSYSTVDITLTLEPMPDTVEEQKFHWLTKTTFQAAWLSFLAVVRGFLHIAIWLLAFSPLLIVIFIALWIVRKRKQTSGKTPMP